MLKKNKLTMDEAFGKELRSTGGMGGQSPAYLEWAFGELIKRIELRKTLKKNGKISVEFNEREYSNLIDGLERAQQSGIIINKYEKEADEACYQIFKIRNALEVIPVKGAKLPHFKEVVKRLGGELPKRGKQETYKAQEVVEYHKECLNNIKEDLGIEKLQTTHKKQAVRLVIERFGFASFDAARKYLTRQKAKNLPFGH